MKNDNGEFKIGSWPQRLEHHEEVAEKLISFTTKAQTCLPKCRHPERSRRAARRQGPERSELRNSILKGWGHFKMKDFVTSCLRGGLFFVYQHPPSVGTC
jgi:hypothetical protein